MITIKQIKPYTERFFSRSSGPGGQHVNKSSTKVQLTFDIMRSELREIEKRRLLRKFPNGFIRVVNQETRYQTQNTRMAYEQLLELIQKNLLVPKKRIKKKAPHQTKGGKIRKMMKDKLQKYRKSKLG